MSDNKKYLIPMNKRTKSEQSRIARMGGIKSGESRRKTKELVKISSFLHDFLDSQKEDVRVSLKKIVQEGGQPLINLTKVIMEATEGTKIKADVTTQAKLPDGLSKDDLIELTKLNAQ